MLQNDDNSSTKTSTACKSEIESVALQKIRRAITVDNSYELQQLLNENYVIDINAQYETLGNSTILMIACSIGSLECVKVLIDNDADVNKQCPHDKNALTSACMSGNLELLHYLFDHKLVYDDVILKACFVSVLSQTSLPRLEVIKVLLSHVQDINYRRNQTPYTFLYFACRSGWLDLVKLLFELGAHRNLFDDSRDGVLLVASARGYLNIVKLLIEYNISESISIQHGVNAAYCEACSKHYYDIARYLVEHGIDVNAVNMYGYCPLEIAIYCCRFELVELLIEKGADIHVPNSLGGSMLNLACLYDDNLAIAQVLLDYGIDVYLANTTTGQTALVIAALAKRTEFVKLLLERGADVTRVDLEGLTVLDKLNRLSWNGESDAIVAGEITELCMQYIDCNRPGAKPLLK